MKIFVELFDHDKTIAVEIDKDDQITKLRAKIQELAGIQIDDYKLVYDDEQLLDFSTVGDYKITPDAIVMCIDRKNDG